MHFAAVTFCRRRYAVDFVSAEVLPAPLLLLLCTFCCCARQAHQPLECSSPILATIGPIVRMSLVRSEHGGQLILLGFAYTDGVMGWHHVLMVVHSLQQRYRQPAVQTTGSLSMNPVWLQHCNPRMRGVTDHGVCER
jgi:hypothetical protein